MTGCCQGRCPAEAITVRVTVDKKHTGAVWRCNAHMQRNASNPRPSQDAGGKFAVFGAMIDSKRTHGRMKDAMLLTCAPGWRSRACARVRSFSLYAAHFFRLPPERLACRPSWPSWQASARPYHRRPLPPWQMPPLTAFSFLPSRRVVEAPPAAAAQQCSQWWW